MYLKLYSTLSISPFIRLTIHHPMATLHFPVTILLKLSFVHQKRALFTSRKARTEFFEMTTGNPVQIPFQYQRQLLQQTDPDWVPRFVTQRVLFYAEQHFFL